MVVTEGVSHQLHKGFPQVTTLNDLFDEELYLRMIEEKFVRVQTNSDNTLFIANYSEKAQFAREWNDVTLNCRGLIYDFDGNVIARGFKKFFNWDDSSQPYPPQGPCLRAPKMDGSLGILYKHKGNWSIATRGSFSSDQALWATNWLQTSAFVSEAQKITPWRDDRTYLFEIIFPENRIVVDYHGDERLVLLDVIETATGKSDLAEFDELLYLDKVEKVSLPGFQDTMDEDIPTGEEGFVFYWPDSDLRVKMKSAEYVELHRMIFGLNARSVWQRMGEGESIEDIAVKLPDEFHPWVKEIGMGLIKQRNRIFADVVKEFGEAIMAYKPGAGQNPEDRRAEKKAFAERVKFSPLKSYLFLMFDHPGGEIVKDAIWKDLRPAGGIGISTVSEDVA
jgi:RNA ligase